MDQIKVQGYMGLYRKREKARRQMEKYQELTDAAWLDLDPDERNEAVRLIVEMEES